MSAPGRRRLVRATWTLAVALVAVLALMTFVCTVKHVESGSMEPTIFGSPVGGESVLVLYGAFEPARFDYVVLEREGEAVPIVKRVAGLPTESVRISNGDLLIDGRRLPPGAPRPAPILIFDSRLQRVDEVFEPARGREGLWSERAGEWSLDARDLAVGSSDGMMSLHRPLTDGYLAPDGSLVRGEIDVNDAILECEVLPREARGRLLFELTEQGDVFRFSLEPRASRTARASISRRNGGQPEEVLETRDVPLVPGAWTRISCSNVDNTLAFEIAGAPEPLCSQYAENRFDEGDHLKEGKSFGSRVRFGGEGGSFAFRSVRILRDVYYTAHGTHGVSEPVDLGPGEYFVLGDNSASSRDSRQWGPIHGSRIVGRPVWVVWPPSRVRSLPAAVPGPCGR